MNVQNQRSPLEEVTPHAYYDEVYEMFIVAGHSAALSFVMEDRLHEEISRGLWWFFGSLLAGVSICFIIFSICFERRLYTRVTRPISELSREIKNPKEFMAARNKANDVYARKGTDKSEASGGANRQNSQADLNERDTQVTEGAEARPVRR